MIIIIYRNFSYIYSALRHINELCYGTKVRKECDYFRCKAKIVWNQKSQQKRYHYLAKLRMGMSNFLFVFRCADKDSSHHRPSVSLWPRKYPLIIENK